MDCWYLGVASFLACLLCMGAFKLIHGVLRKTPRQAPSKAITYERNKEDQEAPIALSEKDKKFIQQTVQAAKKQILQQLLAALKSTVVLPSFKTAPEDPLSFSPIDEGMVNVSSQEELEGQVVLEESTSEENIQDEVARLKSLLPSKH